MGPVSSSDARNAAMVFTASHSRRTSDDAKSLKTSKNPLGHLGFAHFPVSLSRDASKECKRLLGMCGPYRWPLRRMRPYKIGRKELHPSSRHLLLYRGWDLQPGRRMMTSWLPEVAATGETVWPHVVAILFVCNPRDQSC